MKLIAALLRAPFIFARWLFVASFATLFLLYQEWQRRSFLPHGSMTRGVAIGQKWRVFRDLIQYQRKRHAAKKAAEKKRP